MNVCAGIADRLLLNLRRLGVLKDVFAAGKIFAHAKIAVSSCQAQGATAKKQTQSRKQIRKELIFATGFRWTKNTVIKQTGSKAT